MQVSHYAALAFIAAASFCLPGFAAEPDGPTALVTQTEILRSTVEERLRASLLSNARKAEQEALLKYYAVPDQALLWVDKNGLTERGKTIASEIRKADDYGLRASDYSLPNVDDFQPNGNKAIDWLADAEIKISYAALEYARDARGGRIDPQRINKNLDPTLAIPDPYEVIQSISIRTDPATYLRSFQPQHPQFEALRHKLIELRGEANKSKKPNNATIKAILVNMERWRWLPDDLGTFFVNVNVPEFVVRVVDDGKVIHQAHVVVGKTNKPTPVFSDEMTEVVFNPVWNVPSSVKTEEILPWVMRSGGGGLFGGGWSTRIFEINNLHVKYRGREVDPRTIDWGRVDIRNLEIYQPPGRGNVLGHVKFVFPNEHDVYMHDTTEKNYYGQPYRAVSHGCVRVQNPDQLALVILRHDQGWTQERVASAFRGSGDNHVALRQEIPVYISYFTLRVNDDGSISTFKDIYGHDIRMIAALNGKNVGFDAPTNDDRDAADRVKQAAKRDRRNRPANNFALRPFGF